jgi:PST family polysaccharide transporter
MSEKLKHNASAERKSTLSVKILKVMSLFSGLQVFNILCSIIKMKFVAIWLQAVGVGLFGIFNTTIETISTLTDLGLRQSAVRDIAIANGNTNRLAKIIAVVRRWSIFSGIIGAIIICGLSPFLANHLLNRPNMWWAFALLSASMLFNAIVNGEQAILQGTGMLRQIAKGSLFASLIGLLISIPLFRFLGETSVPLSFIAYSSSALIAFFWLRYKSPVNVSINKSELKEGYGFIRLGIYMAIAAFITNLAQVSFMGWLNSTASTSEVGYFQAGTTLVIRYMGLIFTAISMEYYPRLAANHLSFHRTRLFVSHETSLILLVVTPMISLFLLLREVIVKLLYSGEFVVIIPFISLAVLCTIFKAIGWCMAFTIVAKGDGKMFITTEVIDSIIGLCLNIFCYRLWGLEGIGISYILWYAIYCIMIGIVCHKRYHITLSAQALKTIFFSIIAAYSSYFCINNAPFAVSAILLPAIAIIFLYNLKISVSRKHHKP